MTFRAASIMLSLDGLRAVLNLPKNVQIVRLDLDNEGVEQRLGVIVSGDHYPYTAPLCSLIRIPFEEHIAEQYLG